METIRGHCLCGAVGFELDGPHNWVGHCHCESCRRATASPVTTFIGHPNGQWRWTGDTPGTFQSSPGTTRGFCGTCGSPVSYVSDRHPDETHFYAALLENPGAVIPTAHFHYHEHLPWPTIADSLDKPTPGEA